MEELFKTHIIISYLNLPPKIKGEETYVLIQRGSDWSYNNGELISINELPKPIYNYIHGLDGCPIETSNVYLRFEW